MATVPDTRGPTLVQKHRERMQADKERRAVATLSQSVPHVSKLVRQMALELCEFETEAALQLIRDFEADHADQVRGWADERRAHLLRLEEAEARRKVEMERMLQQARGRPEGALPRGGGDASSSGSSDDSDSDSDRGKRKKRDRKDKKKSKKSKKSSKKSKKDEKKEKRKRVDDEEEDEDNMTNRFGRFGIVRESDLDRKRPEFAVWAHEIRGIGIDNLPQREERELFKDYCEDFNTATLPHRKYYDLAKYEEERARKARRGDKHEEARKFVLDDEATRLQEMMEKRRQEQEDRLRQAYMELKTTNKADEMRHQEELKAKLSLAYKTGDKRTAENILDRLRKDDDKYKGRAGARPAPK